LKQLLIVLSLLVLFSTVGYSQLTLTPVVTQQPTCAAPLGGEITATVSGGVEPYTLFIVSIPPGYSESIVGSIGQTVFILPAGGHAPLGEGIYLITVTDSDIPFSFDSQNVLLSISQPVITVPPAAIEICENAPVDNILARVSALPAGGTFTFSGSGVTGNSFDPSGLNGLITIGVQYDLGTCTVNDSFEYNVNAAPVPSLAGPASVCEGATLITYITDAGQTNYAWVVSGGGTVTAGGGGGDNSVTVTWNTPGARTVSVNYENAAGCSATAPTTLNVTVNPLPVPTISGQASVCDGDSEIYTTEGGLSNYAWLVSGGNISSGGGVNDNTITITWNTVGAQSVSVNYQDTNGCTASSPTVYPVMVNALPAPALGGPVIVCEGITGNIYTTDPGQNNYVWNVSAGGTITAGGTATDNTVIVTWNTAGPELVSINYQNAAGCSALASTNLNVTVNAVPVPTLGGPNDVCEGAVSNVYTTEAAQSNYVWVVSGGGTVTNGGTLTDNTVEVTWNTAGAQTVSVNYDNAANCTAATPAIYNVNVNALPVPTIAGPATVCDGSVGNVYSTESGMTNYTWVVTGGIVSLGGGVGDNTVTVTWNTVGAQSVSVNYDDANNCTAVSATNYPVMVNTLPNPTITGNLVVCEASTTIYSTEAGQNNYSWVVSSGGTIVNGGGVSDNTIEITWNTAGPETLSVDYQNAGGCNALVPTTENITVNALPIPTLAGPNDVCEGSTLNIYTTEAAQNNYAWVVSAGGSITNGGTITDNTVEVTWTTSGTQTVSVNYEDANTCSAANATVFNVNVNALPAPSLTGSAVVCEASTGNNYTTEVGQSNYVWVVSAGGTITSGGSGTDDFVEVTWTGTGPQTISINYDDANGCTAISAFVFNVTVDALPTGITFSGPINPICEDETANLDIQIVGGTGPFELDLSTDGGGTVSETVPILDNNLVSYATTALVSTTTFTIFEVRDLGTNCLMDPGNFAAPVVVTVNPKATIVPILPIAACISDGTINLSGTVGGSASSGTWTLENNGVPANLSGSSAGPGVNEFIATYTLDPGDAGLLLTFRLTTDDPDGPGPGGCTAVFQDVPAAISVAAPTETPMISGTSDVCTTTISETYTSTNVTDAVLYVWDLGTSGATIVSGLGTTSIDVDFTSSAPGNYTFSVFGSNGCGNGPTAMFNVIVNAGPQINTQPFDVSVCEGSDATFTIVASGSSIAYQWEESTDSGVNFNPLSGETNASLTLSGTAIVQNGNIYQAIVSSTGCPSVTSNPVTLTVNIEAVVTSQPQSQTVCMDDNVTISVVAANATSFQWEESFDSGANFITMAGETNPDLQINNIQLSANGNQYRAIISSTGCLDVVSAVATLTVIDCTPPNCSTFNVRVDNPINASCGGTDGSFTLVPESGVAPYVVEIDKNDGSGFVQSAPGITGLGPGSYDYRVTDSQGCQFTGSVIISEKQLVANFTGILNPVCNGENGSVVITITTGAGNYEYSFDNQVTWNTFISGAPVPVPPGVDYTISVRDNTNEYCPASSGLISITDPTGITYTVGTITESVPERASGIIDFLSVSGGVPGYEMDIELVTPTAPSQYQPQIVNQQGIVISDDGSGNFSITLNDLFAGFYQIFIRDVSNCEIEVLTPVSGMLEVPMDNNLFIPNVFTPNGDGVNDFFFIRNMPEDSPTSVSVVNRWGKKVYENSDYQNDWDANGLADGIYYYTVGLGVWRGTR